MADKSNAQQRERRPGAPFVRAGGRSIEQTQRGIGFM
jgi:hypothetical protein